MTPGRTYLNSINPLVPRLRYRAYAGKYEPLLPWAESLKRDKIKTIFYRCLVYNAS